MWQRQAVRCDMPWLPWATVAICVKKSLVEILSNVEDALPQAHAQAPHVP